MFSLRKTGNTYTLHIVFAHIIQVPPSAAQSITGGLNCGNGPSNGTCWWYGSWELIYADVNLDGTGTPVVDPLSPSTLPYLKNGSIVYVNPRNAVGIPVDDVTGAGTINPSTNVLTPTGSPVLMDADIRSFFDELDHEWMLRKLLGAEQQQLSNNGGDALRAHNNAARNVYLKVTRAERYSARFR